MSIYLEYHTLPNGQVHRTDGPAIVYHDGDYMWLQNGKYHREDGPAIKIGNSYYWYRNEKEFSGEMYTWMKENGIDRSTENPNDIILINLKLASL